MTPVFVLKRSFNVTLEDIPYITDPFMGGTHAMQVITGRTEPWGTRILNIAEFIQDEVGHYDPNFNHHHIEEKIYRLFETGTYFCVSDNGIPFIPAFYWKEIPDHPDNGEWNLRPFTYGIFHDFVEAQIQRLSSDKRRQLAEEAEIANEQEFARQAYKPKEPKGLHNQTWDKVDVKRGSFNTRRKIDLNTLSVQEEIVKEALIEQGRNKRDIQQLLSSGDNFEIIELQPGTKLYGFDSLSHGEGKPQSSMYWTDETGYQDVKTRFYKNGDWDKEGVKNYLALPCYNRADTIDTAEVTQKQFAIRSTIGLATEQIAYTNSDYTTGMMGKIMPGGGSQITPNAQHLSSVSRLKDTP
jgi:hypothetical protein